MSHQTASFLFLSRTLPTTPLTSPTQSHSLRHDAQRGSSEAYGMYGIPRIHLCHKTRIHAASFKTSANLSFTTFRPWSRNPREARCLLARFQADDELKPSLKREMNDALESRSSANRLAKSGSPVMDKRNSSAVSTDTLPAVVTVTPSSRLTTCRFVVPKYVTAFGQQLRVVGEIPELGNWDPLSAPVMTWQTNHKWILDLDLDLSQIKSPKNTLEFKIVVVVDKNASQILATSSSSSASPSSTPASANASSAVTGGQGIEWEEGPNRSIKVGESASQSIPTEAMLAMICRFGLTDSTKTYAILPRTAADGAAAAVATSLRFLRNRARELGMDLDSESMVSDAKTGMESKASESDSEKHLDLEKQYLKRSLNELNVAASSLDPLILPQSVSTSLSFKSVCNVSSNDKKKNDKGSASSSSPTSSSSFSSPLTVDSMSSAITEVLGGDEIQKLIGDVSISFASLPQSETSFMATWQQPSVWNRILSTVGLESLTSEGTRPTATSMETLDKSVLDPSSTGSAITSSLPSPSPSPSPSLLSPSSTPPPSAVSDPKGRNESKGKTGRKSKKTEATPSATAAKAEGISATSTPTLTPTTTTSSNMTNDTATPSTYPWKVWAVAFPPGSKEVPESVRTLAKIQNALKSGSMAPSKGDAGLSTRIRDSSAVYNPPDLIGSDLHSPLESFSDWILGSMEGFPSSDSKILRSSKTLEALASPTSPLASPTSPFSSPSSSSSSSTPSSSPMSPPPSSLSSHTPIPSPLASPPLRPSLFPSSEFLNPSDVSLRSQAHLERLSREIDDSISQIDMMLAGQKSPSSLPYSSSSAAGQGTTPYTPMDPKLVEIVKDELAGIEERAVELSDHVNMHDVLRRVDGVRTRVAARLRNLKSQSMEGSSKKHLIKSDASASKSGSGPKSVPLDFSGSGMTGQVNALRQVMSNTPMYGNHSMGGLPEPHKASTHKDVSANANRAMKNNNAQPLFLGLTPTLTSAVAPDLDNRDASGSRVVHPNAPGPLRTTEIPAMASEEALEADVVGKGAHTFDEKGEPFLTTGPLNTSPALSSSGRSRNVVAGGGGGGGGNIGSSNSGMTAGNSNQRSVLANATSSPFASAKDGDVERGGVGSGIGQYMRGNEGNSGELMSNQISSGDAQSSRSFEDSGASDVFHTPTSHLLEDHHQHQQHHHSLKEKAVAMGHRMAEMLTRTGSNITHFATSATHLNQPDHPYDSEVDSVEWNESLGGREDAIGGGASTGAGAGADAAATRSMGSDSMNDARVTRNDVTTDAGRLMSNIMDETRAEMNENMRTMAASMPLPSLMGPLSEREDDRVNRSHGLMTTAAANTTSGSTTSPMPYYSDAFTRMASRDLDESFKSRDVEGSHSTLASSPPSSSSSTPPFSTSTSTSENPDLDLVQHGHLLHIAVPKHKLTGTSRTIFHVDSHPVSFDEKGLNQRGVAAAEEEYGDIQWALKEEEAPAERRGGGPFKKGVVMTNEGEMKDDYGSDYGQTTVSQFLSNADASFDDARSSSSSGSKGSSMNRSQPSRSRVVDFENIGSWDDGSLVTGLSSSSSSSSPSSSSYATHLGSTAEDRMTDQHVLPLAFAGALLEEEERMGVPLTNLDPKTAVQHVPYATHGVDLSHTTDSYRLDRAHHTQLSDLDLKSKSVSQFWDDMHQGRVVIETESAPECNDYGHHFFGQWGDTPDHGMYGVYGEDI